jgi:2-polyprenyl-3-methyl-5-hydroxy-6-metoxy-1,4-benzoquinol methylase
MEVMPIETRFQFGQNWQRFLSILNDERIQGAERSLKSMLDTETLTGQTFLDIGCGSGLFSLAAMRLGARRVHSFDYDPYSVACTFELKRKYFSDSSQWTIERGSALDLEYLNSLGQWDIVYSWGVLHHTGNMWQALENVSMMVRSEGKLFISIYNDQGALSKFWRRVKRLYNRSGVARATILILFIPVLSLSAFVIDLLHGRNPRRRYRELDRGMSMIYDWVDWLGGYPFEVAKPDRVVDFCRKHGFELRHSKTVGTKSACNEFVFSKP